VKEVEGVALESSIADGDVYSSVDVRSYEQMEAAFFSQYRVGGLLWAVSWRSI